MPSRQQTSRCKPIIASLRLEAVSGRTVPPIEDRPLREGSRNLADRITRFNFSTTCAVGG